MPPQKQALVLVRPIIDQKQEMTENRVFIRYRIFYENEYKFILNEMVQNFDRNLFIQPFVYLLIYVNKFGRQ